MKKARHRALTPYSYRYNGYNNCVEMKKARHRALTPPTTYIGIVLPKTVEMKKARHRALTHFMPGSGIFVINVEMKKARHRALTHTESAEVT